MLVWWGVWLGSAWPHFGHFPRFPAPEVRNGECLAGESSLLTSICGLNDGWGLLTSPSVCYRLEGHGVSDALLRRLHK